MIVRIVVCCFLASFLIAATPAGSGAPGTASVTETVPTVETLVTVDTVEETFRQTSQRIQKLPARLRTGATQALMLIQTKSPELCKLMGVEFLEDSAAQLEVQRSIQADGENLTEEIGDGAGDASNVAGLEGDVLAGETGADDVEDDEPIDINEFRSLWLDFVDDGGADYTDAGIEKHQLVDVILNWLGTRYRFGGDTRRGIDCSAFTRMVYTETTGAVLPRTAVTQADVGMRIDKTSDLRFGDLVFFRTRRYARITHVGVYLGDGLFAHASSRYGVTVSSLESGYYNARFCGGSRITDRDLAQLIAE